MAEQGAGGVEINPIALPEHYQNLPGEQLAWLSREWNAVLAAAVDECNELGMIADLIVGTGWPFGGAFLNENETIQGVELQVERVAGPVSFEKQIDIPLDDDHKILQVKLFPATVETVDSGIDLSYHVDENNWLRVDIQTGEWDLYIVTWRNKFRDVMFGTRGADGPVLDHYNENAVRKYLQRMSSELNPLFGGSMGNGLRAMFCDSIELEGANWTSDLLQEFEERNGYDVGPYIPLLLADTLDTTDDFADTLRRVRYEFSKTLADLFMERFILVYQDWCVQNGVVSRYQAYGYPWLITDLVDGYLVPDIPEGDQWLYNGGWVKEHRIDAIRYAIWNKYASSGGHLAGRDIISSEAMTNTRGVFEATLEYIKQATDLNIVGGINHFVLHGFNYSPLEAEYPGWIRFGTYFNENNPWWPYLHLWSNYTARLCQVFQDSQYVAQVAIMGPTADIWSEHGLDRNPWATTPGYLHDLWQSLNHHGYCSDFVNDTILQNSVFENGKLTFGQMSYDILICCDPQAISPETAQALFNFAENGGKILFINSTPSRSLKLQNHEAHDLVVEETMNTILSEQKERVKLERFRERQDLTEWIGKRMEAFEIAPAVRISNPDNRLFMIHHKQENRDIYFFCNSDRERTITFEAEFPSQNKSMWLWDAETGERSVFGSTAQPQFLELKPLESKLFVIQDSADGPPTNPWSIDPDKSLDVIGPWQVTFEPARGKSFEKMLVDLVDLSTEKDTQTFSGTATYKTRFLVEATDNVVLDLGEVYDIAEVKVNDVHLSVKWWGAKQFLLKEELEHGINQLEVKVTTTLFNYVQSLEDNPTVEYWLERRRDKGLAPSGLVGPVRLFKTAS